MQTSWNSLKHSKIPEDCSLEEHFHSSKFPRVLKDSQGSFRVFVFLLEFIKDYNNNSINNNYNNYNNNNNK